MARTHTYELARARIAAHHAAFGDLPTAADLSAWFRDTHASSPSQTTLVKALREYRAAIEVTHPADAFSLSLALTIQAQADANAEAKLAERRATLELEAKERISTAETNSNIAVDRAKLDQTTAETRATLVEASSKAVLDQATREIDAAHARNETLTNVYLAVSESLAESLAERKAALTAAQAAAEASRLERMSLEAACDALRLQLTREQSDAALREQRAHEQFQSSQALWLKEIATLRDKVVSLEKALLAERVAKDDAVRQARREITEAIAIQLKELAVSVGGVNQVHNTHMGGLRTQLEETIVRLDHVATLLNQKNRASHAALPARTDKKGRK